MHGARQRIFYGWIIVAAAIVIIALGVGLMFSLGVFMEPLETAFGWSRGQIGRASLLGWLSFGLFSFVFGALSDRLGTRLVVMIGGLLFGVGMLVLSSMHTLWHLYLAYGVFIGAGTGAFMVPLTSTVTRWFTRRRALVVALTNCGAAVGSALLAPLTRYLIMSYSWRAAFWIYALLAWIIILPLALLIRNRPQDIGLQPFGERPVPVSHTPVHSARASLTFTEVLAQPAFWIIAVVNFLCCASHSGPLFHMVSAVIDSGVDKLTAAAVFAGINFASVPARVGTGLLADRLGSKPILITWLCLQAVAIFLYVFAQGVGSYVAFGVYFGLAFGGIMPLYAVVTRACFGERAMGASYGGIFLCSCLGMGLGSWLGGWLFDHFGSYLSMYLVGAVFAGAGAVLAFWLRPPLSQPAASMAVLPG